MSEIPVNHKKHFLSPVDSVDERRPDVHAEEEAALEVAGQHQAVHGEEGEQRHCVEVPVPDVVGLGCNSIDIIGMSPNLSLIMLAVLRLVLTLAT